MTMMVTTCAISLFIWTVNRLVFIVAMSVSSSINMYSGNGALGAKVVRSQMGVMGGCPELFSGKLVNCTRTSAISNPNSLGFSLSAKPLRCESNGDALRKFRVPCHAVSMNNSSSFSVGQKFHLEDIIEAQQFDRETLSAIFEVAKQMEKVEKGSPGSEILKGYLMATFFYEPSTRTRLSFESAMKRLGSEVLTTENAR